MPLRALYLPTNTVISASDFSSSLEIRKTYPKEAIVCPFCKTQMTPIKRRNSILYFRHNQKCSSSMEYHPESYQHLLGKTILAKHLKNELAGVSDVEVIVEYPIPEAGENGRIADVAAIFPTGFIIVYECQLASITTEMLEKRTKDYEKAGVDVTWFLGEKAASQSNKDWCIEYFGDCFCIKFEKELSEEQNLFTWSSGGEDSVKHEGKDFKKSE
jgi:competence CoiA-like predicted nuclease